MGIAELNEETSTLTISANLYFYGTAANDEICFQIGEDINAHWNIEDAYATVNGKKYKVVFDVKGMFAPHLRQTDVLANDDPKNNYIRLEEYVVGNISFVDGVNSNTGYFLLANIINNSTTAAHEFGHSLGLTHPTDLDLRGQGVPGIMYPRGTITDPQFQYDPDAQPLTTGGTMNPFFRKVLQSDINSLHLNRLHFNKDGRAIVGDYTAVWHYRHTQENIY